MNSEPKVTALSLQKEQDVLDRAARVRDILDELKKGEAKFKNVTKLSEHVAGLLAKMEGAPCSPVTLRRNEVYRAILDEFCNNGGVERSQRRSDSELISLQLKVRALGIENRNLVEENRNLLKIIAAHKESELLIEHQSLIESVDKVQVESERYSEKEAALYALIFQLMKVADGYEIDNVLGVVTDTVGDREVFIRSEIPGFFDWYSKEINS